jgi:hypothetical protein
MVVLRIGMKKLSFVFLPLLLIFHLSTSLFAETLFLATFNIRIFSHNSRDDQELLKICSLLKEFDFIAIQEVKDTQILDRTVSMLKEQFSVNYKYIASPKVGRGIKE